jgi:hypothetical protein
MDGALEAIADYVDLKSPRTAGNKCAHRYRYASVANGRFAPMIASGVELTRCLQIRIYAVRLVSSRVNKCRFVFGRQKFRANKYRQVSTSGHESGGILVVRPAYS